VEDVHKQIESFLTNVCSVIHVLVCT